MAWFIAFFILHGQNFLQKSLIDRPTTADQFSYLFRYSDILGCNWLIIFSSLSIRHCTKGNLIFPPVYINKMSSAEAKFWWCLLPFFNLFPRQNSVNTVTIDYLTKYLVDGIYCLFCEPDLLGPVIFGLYTYLLGCVS